MAERKVLSRSFTSTSPPTSQAIIPAKNILSAADYILSCNIPLSVGWCSSVYLGSFQGKNVAVKCFSLSHPDMQPAKGILLKEAQEILKIDHSNVIKCMGVCIEKGSIVLELTQIRISKTKQWFLVNSLRQLIDTVGDVIETDLINEALFQILEGLHYLHSNQVVHGDLKSANVLVTEEDDNYVFKLTDFGGCHAQLTTRITSNFSLNTSKRTKPGTTSFEAPEVFLCMKKSPENDLYSFAMVMHELLYITYSHPWESVFKNCSSYTLASMIINAVKRGERQKIEESSPYTIMMQSCWAQVPSDRPSLTSLMLEIQNLEV
ncbi:hypothetical protein GHT06_008889 [Daphnia sinensis]|uniref:Protein kinase domain-containing protein n=1 Tax=Daphnia sinensis TaxID=1820382 RepID=A0AAD5LLW8_9CRUS|nr:hypothetical protein GHT06_008889 [Daphnia sinensis]